VKLSLSPSGSLALGLNDQTSLMFALFRGVPEILGALLTALAVDLLLPEKPLSSDRQALNSNEIAAGVSTLRITLDWVPFMGLLLPSLRRATQSVV